MKESHGKERRVHDSTKVRGGVVTGALHVQKKGIGRPAERWER